MLNSKGFDLWADGYDKSVNLSEESNKYPFAGYKAVLGTIYRTVRDNDGRTILDIGFGTGVLTKKLYDDGCTVYGMDFSEKMIETAKRKMPEAVLVKHDFTQGFPECFKDRKFDYIISTYAIHHLEDSQKISFIEELMKHLNEGGQVLLGDVAFETRAELESCLEKSGDDWDEDEIYAVAQDLRPAFPDMKFEKISFCAGVFSFYR